MFQINTIGHSKLLVSRRDAYYHSYKNLPENSYTTHYWHPNTTDRHYHHLWPNTTTSTATKNHYHQNPHHPMVYGRQGQQAQHLHV